MPVINVKMTHEDGGVTKEQKELLASKMTQVFQDVFGRGAQTAVVIIEEVLTDNYAIGGKTISQLRVQQRNEQQ